MYTFSSKLKTFSIILMVLGILGIGYGFLTAPKNIQDVEKILAEESHHGGGHGEADASHGAADAHGMPKAARAEKDHDNAVAADANADAHHIEVAEGHEADAPADSTHTAADSVHVAQTNAAAAGHGDNNDHGADAGHGTSEADAHAAHEKHLHHVLEQLQNKPWAALYVACIFVMLISLGALVFYAIQQVAQAGWSPVLFRVMQAISSYLPVGSVIFFVFLCLIGFHVFPTNHMFVWTHPEVVANDAIIAGKSGYLNVPFWLIRAAIFLIGWNLYLVYTKKYSLLQDDANDDFWYKKNFKMSAAFLVFFIVSESIMSWDWIMSIDPHWYSTLFGWYVFASFFVSGITVIALVTLYMKSKGLLEYVNTSHIHDLAKFMFGISVFWTYLWFSQFMLIWYSNIPEEVTYFVQRIEDYNLPFFGMVVMNFLFPVLILINTDFKRLTWIIVMAGIIILAGHYIDFFNMIMPASVGDRWFIGFAEIGALMFFAGLFIFVVFTAMAKSPLLAKRNPLIEESRHFHY